MDWNVNDEITNTPDRHAGGLCPEGQRTFRIHKASQGPHKYKEGEFLMLTLADEAKEYGLVWCDIAAGSGGAAMATMLAQAIGGAAFGGKVSLDPADLVGQRVIAEIYHYTVQKTGAVKAYVRKFLAADPVVETAEETSRSPARRTADQRIAGDPNDVPF